MVDHRAAWEASLLSIPMESTPMKHGCVIGLLLLASFLPACEWTGHTRRRHQIDHGYVVGPLDARKLGYRIQWATDIALPRKHRISQVVLLDDVVIIIQESSNIISANSIRDGKPLWQRRPTDEVGSFFEPVQQGNVILANTEWHQYSLDVRDGETLSKSTFDSVASTAAAVIDRYAIFGSDNGMVFAHDIVAGYSKWQYQMPAAIVARPIAIGSNVFVADTSGFYALLDGSNGSLIWKDPTFGAITVTPGINNFGIFLASTDRKLYAMGSSDGRERWTKFTNGPLTRSPIVLGKHLYLPLHGGGLVALYAVDGTERWRYDTDVLPVTESDRKLLVYGHDFLAFVDVETGQTVTDVPTEELKTVLPGPEQSVILVTHTGRLVRLDPAQ